MHKLLLIGPQGAGKGTQAEKIVQKYGIPHISTGDIFRKHMSEGTELGKLAKQYVDEGKLVPDEVTIQLVQQRLQEPDCVNGFLFDGFPRNLVQAHAIDTLLHQMKMDFTAVLCLDIERSLLIERLTGRRTCATCGRIYHTSFNPPQVEGVCDFDGGKLLQRADDTLEKIESRLTDYFAQTEPLITHYRNKGIVKEIRANQAIEQVFSDIQGVLDV